MSEPSEREIGVATEAGFERLPMDNAVTDDAPESEEDAFVESSLQYERFRNRGGGYHYDDHKIAQLPNIPQFKVVWKMKKVGPIKTKWPQSRRRLRKTHVFARVGYPTTVDKDLVTKCTVTGLAAAGAAVLSGVGAALAAQAFLTVFGRCAGEALAEKIEISIYTEVEYTDWKAV